MISLRELAIERPVGSKNNENIMELLCKEAKTQGLDLIRLPIETKCWYHKYSFAEYKGKKVELHPSPFSHPFSGKGKVALCSNWNDVKNNPDSILIFQKPMTEETLMPLCFPVYFPPEHKEKYDIIKEARPKCIITETGKHKMSGLNPYPFFEDGNLSFPSAYKDMEPFFTDQVETYIEIQSECTKIKTSQVLFSKQGKNNSIIVICAHMDSKYGTPGALDNAAGIFTLYKLFENLKEEKLNSTIHFIPFNGEENYSIPGQMQYLDFIKREELHISAVINIDSPGFCGSQNAVSFYNIDIEEQNLLLKKTKDIKKGQEWYAGDHAMFSCQNIPCVVATSDNLFEKGIHYTHTEKDTTDIVDLELLNKLSSDLKIIVKELDTKA